LVFFFVCTTIVEEEWILVQLLPYDPSPPSAISDRNVFNILVNADNAVMSEGNITQPEKLERSLEEFILNFLKQKHLPLMPSSAIISLKCGRGTSYERYIEVFNVLKKTYNKLWENSSISRFGKLYDMLLKRNHNAIRSEIPLLISQAGSTDLASH